MKGQDAKNHQKKRARIKVFEVFCRKTIKGRAEEALFETLLASL
jgi:hypothetical protein